MKPPHPKSWNVRFLETRSKSPHNMERLQLAVLTQFSDRLFGGTSGVHRQASGFQHIRGATIVNAVTIALAPTFAVRKFRPNSLRVLAVLVFLTRVQFPCETFAQPKSEPTPEVGDRLEQESSFGWGTLLMATPEMIKKINASTTLLADTSTNGLDQTQFDLSASVAAPDLLFASDAYFTLSPSFSAMTVEGDAGGIDLPNKLYRTGTTIAWMWKSSEKTTYSIGLSPGVASDFESSDNAFRLTGHVMATCQWRPDVQFTLGVAYLDRNDISVLPIIGVIWTPREDLRIDLAAPRPRIARRVYHEAAPQGESDAWVFLAGEFGGGSWGVERTPGVTDELTLRDFRINFGFQNRYSSGRTSRLEAGYVFGRKFEYESDGAEFEPNNAMMLRGAFSY